MIDLEHMKASLASFSPKYTLDFDCFWKWKLQVESSSGDILDDNNRTETFARLSRILLEWSAYEGNGFNPNPLSSLKASLGTISHAYSQVRMYDLLSFSEISSQSLETLWHELGRVKERTGNISITGEYQIISVCKPLLLLTGQTLAFDSNVRKNTPDFVPKKSRWSLAEWKSVMRRFQGDLLNDPSTVDFIKRKSLEKFPNAPIVPYGRFLDIYYFVPRM